MRVITGSAKGKRLKTPNGLQTRPTADRVKEAIFSVIQFQLQNARFLDLFAGSGQMGIEALSRGAISAVFVDSSKEAVKLVQDNLKATNFDQQARVFQLDYMSYLNRCNETFDIIFLDPPYAEVFLETALKKISEIDILAECGIIICERPADKLQNLEIPGLSREKDYKYGKSWVTIYRKQIS